MEAMEAPKMLSPVLLSLCWEIMYVAEKTNHNIVT